MSRWAWDETPELHGTEPLTAWRVWFRGLPEWRFMGTEERDAMTESEHKMLHSVFHHHIWRPGRNKAAECSGAVALPEEKHPPYSPAADCQCGFYSLRTLDDLFESHAFRQGFQFQVSMPIIGTVKIWGRIFEAEKGYRSEFAEATSVYLPSEWHSSRWIPKPEAHYEHFRVDVDRVKAELESLYDIPVRWGEELGSRFIHAMEMRRRSMPMGLINRPGVNRPGGTVGWTIRQRKGGLIRKVFNPHAD